MNKGLEYSFKKYNHYIEIKEAKTFYKLQSIYDEATEDPGFKNLIILLDNFHFTFLHFKLVVKCILGVIGIKSRMKKEKKIIRK